MGGYQVGCSCFFRTGGDFNDGGWGTKLLLLNDLRMWILLNKWILWVSLYDWAIRLLLNSNNNLWKTYLKKKVEEQEEVLLMLSTIWWGGRQKRGLWRWIFLWYYCEGGCCWNIIVKVNIIVILLWRWILLWQYCEGRDAKSGRSGRYICAIFFPAGANFGLSTRKTMYQHQCY